MAVKSIANFILILFFLTSSFAGCKKEESKKEELQKNDSFDHLGDLTSEERKDFIGTYTVHGFDDEFIKTFAPNSGLKYHSMYQCGKMESDGKVFRIRITNNKDDLVFEVKRKDKYTFVFRINGKTLDVNHYGPGKLSEIIWIDTHKREWKSNAARIEKPYEECIEENLNIWKAGG